MKPLLNIGTSIQNQVLHTDLNKTSGLKRGMIKSVRSLMIAFRGFTKDQCQLKASALTFYTLLSIVPVIAMLFGIAKGFGLEKRLEAEFKSDLSYNQEVITYIFDLAISMLENTKGGLIAGLSVVLLFWAVMKVLGNIEEAFNDIWNVKQARSWARKFSDYMSVMLLAPVLIIVSSSITVFISTQIESATQSIQILGYFGPLIYFGLRFIPMILTLALFTLTYIIMPNTKVNLSAAVFGAFFGTIMFMIVQWVYLSFQIGVSNYNAIYGGFAALPLFLVWVQTNWLVVLLGAELCVAFQNQSRFVFELTETETSHSNRFIYAVAVLRCLIRRFEEGKIGPTAVEISEEIQISVNKLSRILDALVKCRVISEVNGNQTEEIRYLPAIDIAKLDFDFVIRRLNDYGFTEIPENEVLKKVEAAMQNIRDEFSKSNQNILIKDL